MDKWIESIESLGKLKPGIPEIPYFYQMNSLRRLIISLTLFHFIFASHSFAQEANPEALITVPCKNFHTGTFEYANGDRAGIKIVRKGNKQIETNQVNGDVSIFKVKWEDDCICTLTFVKSNMPNRFSQLAKGKRVVTILDTMLVTSEDFYEIKEVRFGVKNYAAVKKIITKKEAKKRQQALEKKIREDSLALKKAEKAVQDSIVSDSLTKAKAVTQAENEKKVREAAAAKKKAGEDKKAAAQNPPPAKGDEKSAKSEKKEKPKREEKLAKPDKKEEKPQAEKKEKKPDKEE